MDEEGHKGKLYYERAMVYSLAVAETVATYGGHAEGGKKR